MKSEKDIKTPLFDLIQPEADQKLAPASRRSDPYTSHVSEIELDVSGKRAAACAFALSMVLATPGLTANEYEHKAGVPDGHLRKRLNDLWKDKQIQKGRVRRSAVTRKLNQTWWPASYSGPEAITP